jgi:hypothetical protein
LVANYCFDPSTPIIFTLMMEAMRSIETSVHTKATRRNNQEDDILQEIHRSSARVGN